jgi:transketolase
MSVETLDQLCINTLSSTRCSGQIRHPGTPMALVPLVYTIWNRVMRFDPQDPIWPNRDWFVLSNGVTTRL